MVVYWLFRLTIRVMRPLPLWLGYRVAAAVAEVCYHFFRGKQRALNENFARVLGTDDPHETDRVARAAFRNFGKFVVDFIHFPVITRDEVRRRLVFADWTDLDEATDAGRGVLIVTMHFGSWDLGGASLATYGYRVHAIADSYGYTKMDELIHGSRERLGMTVIPMERVGPSVFRALKRGDMLALLIDTPQPGEGVIVDFFGAPAEFSSVPARVALRTGCWVVPAMVVRGPERDTLIRPHVDIRSIRYEPTGNDERDVRALTQQIVRTFEPYIREHPEQWYIFHRAWADEAARVTSEPAAADA